MDPFKGTQIDPFKGSRRAETKLAYVVSPWLLVGFRALGFRVLGFRGLGA